MPWYVEYISPTGKRVKKFVTGENYAKALQKRLKADRFKNVKILHEEEGSLSNPYPSRLDMEERVFDAMVPEIEREGVEHDLSSELVDEKAYVLAEQIGNMSQKVLQKQYSFWAVKLGRKPKAKRRKKK